MVSIVKFLKPLTLSVVILLSLAASAQQSGGGDELREQISSAQAEIERINKLVDTTRAKRNATLADLQLVAGKIDKRRRIVTAIEGSISSAADSIAKVKSRTSELEKQLVSLKASYSELILASYRTMRTQSVLSCLWSSRDFLEASRRLHYVKQIREDLEARARMITSVRDTLSGALTDLSVRRKKLTALEREHGAEIDNLAGEQKLLAKTQAELKGNETKLIAEAENYRKRISDMERQLRRIVENEMQKGAVETTPVSTAATGAFANQRGRLPRPVTGAIVDYYGEHDHPTRKGVKINNKGINFASAASAPVKVVFDGEVRKVFFFQGLGNSVMVRHGNYLTIYANLGKVNVREGDKIKAGAVVGTVAPILGGLSMMHFELWNESENLNPEPWLAK